MMAREPRRTGPHRKTFYTSVVTLRLLRTLSRRHHDPTQHGEGRTVARALRALAKLELAADRGAEVIIRERSGAVEVVDVDDL